MIISLILTTCMFEHAVILSEVRYWSLLGLKGRDAIHPFNARVDSRSSQVLIHAEGLDVRSIA